MVLWLPTELTHLGQGRRFDVQCITNCENWMRLFQDPSTFGQTASILKEWGFNRFNNNCSSLQLMCNLVLLKIHTYASLSWRVIQIPHDDSAQLLSPWKLDQWKMFQIFLFSGAESSFMTLSADHGGEPGNAQVECGSKIFWKCWITQC